MEVKIQQLEQRLVKHYFIAVQNAHIIIEDEFYFIEECFNASMSVEEVAKALINIYMVA